MDANPDPGPSGSLDRRVRAKQALQRSSATLLLLLAPRVLAQPASARDTAAQSAAPQRLPRYHHTAFSWEHSATTETLGVGADPQTSNPTYEMGFSAKPRYYLYEAAWALSLRGDIGLYREFTDSDATTRRGEWSVSDAEVALVYSRRLGSDAAASGTAIEFRPAALVLPTSKASFASGRYFALGTLLAATHTTPLLVGRVRPEVLATFRLAAGYSHWFARATVPTSSELDRVRLTPEGRSVAGDQLSGAGLVRHQLSLSARFGLALGEHLAWTSDAAIQPAWKYELKDEVAICGTIDTGCTQVALSSNDTRYLLRTQFNTEVSLALPRGFSIGVGYSNVAAQIGADGRRRGFFYSPTATFYAALSFVPHEFVTPAPRTATAPSRFAHF